MYTNPCNLSLNPKNTGVDCDSALLATAMLIMVPRAARWTQADINASPYNGNFTAFVAAKCHLAPGQRWYPLFGTAAPVQRIVEANQADVFETMDDGSEIFVMYGKAIRTFSTTKGGLCLAGKFMQFPQGYSFIEADIDGKVAYYEPTTGNFAGFPLINSKGLAPELAGIKTSFKNQFRLCFDKVAYTVRAKLIAPDSTEDILGVNGLLDSEVDPGTANVQSTTHIFLKVKSECAETDLVAEYTGVGAGKIGQISNFVVTAANGTPITPSAVAITNGEVDLTGVYTTATNITVALAAPAVLKANGLPGYEGIVSATVPIP